MRALSEAGLRVPADVAVIGFDDILVSRFTAPALSTVVQPKEDLAAQTVRLLLERIADPALPPRSITLQTRFLSRESD